MIDAEYTQKMNSGESATVPKLELDGLTAGAIADLCNVSSDWRSRNVCIDKGDFADDVNGETKVTGDFSTINGNNFHGKSTSQGEGNQNDGSNQYYFPLQPFQLPVSSRPPHIEPGRVDIRLHALYNKLGKMM